MTGRIFLCYLLFLISAIPLVSQKEYLLQANQAYETGQYQKAIRLYTQYNKINRDSEALGKRGIAYFNYNLVDKAVEDFTAAKKLGNNDPVLYLKMGQSKQFLRLFDEASFFYQKYLELADKNGPYRKLAELEIKNCVFSALETFETAGTLIQSFGDDVNSRYDEVYPIQSPKFGNVFYFSSNRNKSNFDIFSYTLSEDGLWSKNDMTEKPFNNGYHNVALDVDAATINALLYSEVSMSEETIQFASFDLSGQDIVVKLPKDIFEGAKDISIVNHNMVVFSSKKLRGFGGYDIFTVSYKDGSWSTPLNLGGAINSPFDEICPFYSNNLNHFYFSSNRPYCFGGYDIYYCDIANEKFPVNMGYGINSHGDELHFNIDDAGHMATFSSNRKTGLGGYDLYFAYLQDIKNMGVRDSLVFEYLINPDEEFVQVKNRDNLVSLESNNGKLNSAKESKSIEISNKIEAIKERPSDENVEDNPASSVVAQVEKISTVLDSEKKETGDDNVSIKKENTTVNTIEGINNNQPKSDVDNSLNKGDETIANSKTQDSKVHIQKEIKNSTGSEIENKKTSKDLVGTSKERAAEIVEAKKNNIASEITTTQPTEIKPIDSAVLDKEIIIEDKAPKVTSALEKKETEINNPASSTIIGPMEKRDPANIVIENSTSTDKNSLPSIDSSTVTTVIEKEKPSDENNNEAKSKPTNDSSDPPASSKDVVKSSDINYTDKELTPIDAGTKEIKGTEVKTEERPKRIETKPENLKEHKTETLANHRDFKKIEKPWTTFVLPQTLYYRDRQDLTRGENMVKLNQLVVSEFETSTTFVLLAHTDDTELGLPEYVQYNTFKRALKVAEYLNESGIEKNRIRIESLANNYPLIKSDIAGEKINSLYAHNKRVDILIYDKDQIKEDNVIEDGSIPDYAFDRRYELFRSIREGTYYSIEVASSERIFKNAILRLYNDIYIRRDDMDGQNKYYIGIYTKKEDAYKLKDQLLETSSPYAKVVRFVNGKVDNK